MRTPPSFRVLVAVLALVGLTLSAEMIGGAVGASGTGSGSSSGTSSSSSGIRTHVVRPGDTVASIAARHGITANDLRVANGIVGDRLYAGGHLVIQTGSAGGSTAGPSSAPTGSTGSGGTHTVRTGDSLWSIAQGHGVSLSSLLSANGLRSTSLIVPGRKLTIPGGTGSAAASSSSSSSAAAGGSGGSGLNAIRMVCPVPGAGFMNDWGFPRGGTSTGFHQGNDLFAPAGTPIAAPISGALTVGSNKLGGLTFHITSPQGWVVYGAHNAAVVGSDRWVDAGEMIARVGDSGDARGGQPHLHLGLRRASGGFINPYPSLSAAC